jgi:hypothetical protein
MDENDSFVDHTLITTTNSGHLQGNIPKGSSDPCRAFSQKQALKAFVGCPGAICSPGIDFRLFPSASVLCPGIMYGSVQGSPDNSSEEIKTNDSAHAHLEKDSGDGSDEHAKCCFD